MAGADSSHLDFFTPRDTDIHQPAQQQLNTNTTTTVHLFPSRQYRFQSNGYSLPSRSKSGLPLEFVLFIKCVFGLDRPGTVRVDACRLHHLPEPDYAESDYESSLILVPSPSITLPQQCLC